MKGIEGVNLLRHASSCAFETQSEQSSSRKVSETAKERQI